MCGAAAADVFRSIPSIFVVDDVDDGVFVDRLVEAGPACARLEFRFRIKQRKIATLAGKCAFGFLNVQGASLSTAMVRCPLSRVTFIFCRRLVAPAIAASVFTTLSVRVNSGVDALWCGFCVD